MNTDSLRDALIKGYPRACYDDLFVKDWPKFSSKGFWKITHQSPLSDERYGYYKEIIYALCGSGIAEVFDFQRVIVKINSEWTRFSCILEAPTSNEGSSGVIKFSSKTDGCAWLSNFFPTLIVFPDHPENVYFSAEEAYQKKKAEMHGVKLEGQDPVLLKKLGAKIPLSPGFSRENLMHQVLTAKFDLNPILKNQLIKTEGFALREDTDHPYWGIGSDGKGQNHLGVLLESIRANLIQQQPA